MAQEAGSHPDPDLKSLLKM